MRRGIILTFVLFLTFVTVSAQTKIKLWENVSAMKSEKSILYVYPAPDSVRTGVSAIICPGGSYAHLMGIAWEGFEVAKWLNSIGITAFILKYRVSKNGYHHPAMIEDIQQSIYRLRDNASRYNIDPELIGVIGFSAGGHLSLMAGAFYQDNYLEKYGVSGNVNLKPAFVVPVYPVVSMQDSLVHKRSRKNLLGKKIAQEEKDKFSMEMQITENMPPVFLVSTKNDKVVDCRNSIVLEEALKLFDVPHKFLLYDFGGHGFGLNLKRGGEAAKWKEDFELWLYELRIINK
jgi:acetyl esterase/lipase